MYSFYAFQGLKNRIFTTFTRILSNHANSYLSSSSKSSTSMPPMHSYSSFCFYPQYDRVRKSSFHPKPPIVPLPTQCNPCLSHIRRNDDSNPKPTAHPILIDLASSKPRLPHIVLPTFNHDVLESSSILHVKDLFFPPFRVPPPPSTVCEKEENNFPTFSLFSNPRFILR